MKLNKLSKILIGAIIILIITIVFLIFQTQNNNSGDSTENNINATRITNNVINNKNTKLNADFEKYIYALDKMVEARHITDNEIAETYNKMDAKNVLKTNEEFKKSLIYTEELIQEYQEVIIKDRLAINKLNTINNSEIKNAIFDLKQALIFYTETNEETIRSNQYLKKTYIDKQEEYYQKNNVPEVNTAFFLLKDSFSKIDKFISSDTTNRLNIGNINRYKESKLIILDVK